jgi:quinohemoprotein amine dehydrogenase
MGFDIGEASPGEEVIAFCRIVRCDRARLDINMPGKGFDNMRTGFKESQMKKVLLVATFISAFCAVPAAQAQRGRGGAAAAASEDVPEEGIPVTNPLVISKCGTCHARDPKGIMGRISFERSTPEGWEEALKRMVRLNGLVISPADARAIVKYLATYHGLAPEEAKPVMYMPEHRLQDETIVPNDAVRTACTTCHPLGRGLSWRRSKEDWQLLENLHVALYAQADAHFRRAQGGPGGGGGGGGQAPAPAETPGAPPAPEPGAAALEFLSKAAPLHTPEWAAWRARLRAPRITGRWLVSATMPGKGKFFGEMLIEQGSAEDEFKTTTKLKSVKDGSTVSRAGQSVVYAGYSWRGKSKGVGSSGSAPDDLSKESRETLWISPDQSFAEGRWFWGEYQEFGFDVKLVRASEEPTIAGINIYSLKTGSKAAAVTIFGDSLPAQIAAADIDLGAGVKVNKIVSHSKTELVAEVEVAADAVPGERDIGIGRSVVQNAFAVYDHVDYLKVTPDASIARLGSDVHPKGYQQFEAVGYQRGADGKPHTADDIELGPVDSTWSVEEFMAVYGDDDKNYVGKLSETALFTPNTDGPNPERKFGRNNYGDVWVVATAKNDKDKNGKPLVGKSYLVVTVPTYIKWDQPEVN